MATNLDDLTAIRAHFMTQWAADNPSVAFVLDNEPAIDEPIKQTWARMSVAPGAERRRSIYSKTYEQLGRVYLQVFVPVGLADGNGWTIAESFAAAFRDWKSSDYRIRFDTPEFRTSDIDKVYYAIIVSVPYTAQH